MDKLLKVAIFFVILTISTNASAILIDSSIAGTIADTRLGKDGLGDSYIDHKMQLFNSSSSDHRGVTEFDISGISGVVNSANLILTRSFFNYPDPILIYLRGYKGNGVLDLGDFNKRDYFGFVNYNGENTLSIDVTDYVSTLVSNAENFVGFSLKVATERYFTSFLWFYDKYNAQSIAPILEVDTKSVSAPPSIFLFSLGLLWPIIFRLKKIKNHPI